MEVQEGTPEVVMEVQEGTPKVVMVALGAGGEVAATVVRGVIQGIRKIELLRKFNLLIFNVL